MPDYNLRVTKAKVIEKIHDLVTPNIKFCRINCSVFYDQAMDQYNVHITTTDVLYKYIRLSGLRIAAMVMDVFNRNSRSNIHLNYNHKRISIFKDN